MTIIFQKEISKLQYGDAKKITKKCSSKISTWFASIKIVPKSSAEKFSKHLTDIFQWCKMIQMTKLIVTKWLFLSLTICDCGFTAVILFFTILRMLCIVLERWLRLVPSSRKFAKITINTLVNQRWNDHTLLRHPDEYQVHFSIL